MEGPKDSEDSVETPRSGHYYITPVISPEVIYRVSSLDRTTNTDNFGTTTNTPEGIPPLNPLLGNLDANSMDGVDIRLPTFNGNGTKDPEQHWVLCEAVWMVRLVHNADIKKAQMNITILVHEVRAT